MLRHTSVFVCIRQLEFAILQLQMQLKCSLSGLDSTVEGQFVPYLNSTQLIAIFIGEVLLPN